MKKFNNSADNKRIKKKPSWDNTISDLKSYKATPEEIVQRKIDHISKNQQIFFPNDHRSDNKKQQPESVYDRLTKVRYGNQIKENDVNQRKKLVGGMFTTNQELMDLFEQSERTLSTVESLFGDPLKRHKVRPVITPAPDSNMCNIKLNSNNSNCYVLNEFSESENESSKSQSKHESQKSQENNKKSDELSQFRTFIENERKTEEMLENLNNKKQNSKIDIPKMSDASTEMNGINESDSILGYISSRLMNDSCTTDGRISDSNRDLSEKIINYLLNLNRKNAFKIESLNADIIHNKELIDALTLELMNNNEQIKRMKNEFELFTKSVNMELSGMKSLIIKYLDQQVSSNSVNKFPSNYSSNTSNSNTRTSRPNVELVVENNFNNKDERLINEQLVSLQIDHENTQRRLKNLLKIHDSISQVSADMK